MSVFIVAEIGINHNGDISIAKKLIDMAVLTGCNAIKFQKRDIDVVYSSHFLDSPRESPWGATQRDQKSALEFSEEQYDELDEYCQGKSMPWFASAWDNNSVEFLRKYNLKYNKIASAMLPYEPLLTMVAEERKHTLISTGMSSFSEIDRAVEIFTKERCPFELLYTVSLYPCPASRIDLKCIPMLQNRYGCSVGYSGHETSAWSISLGAVAFGATSVERHITLDRTMYGSDQSASLELMGLMSLVRGIRNLEQSLGDGQRQLLDDELAMSRKLRWFNN